MKEGDSLQVIHIVIRTIKVVLGLLRTTQLSFYDLALSFVIKCEKNFFLPNTRINLTLLE